MLGVGCRSQHGVCVVRCWFRWKDLLAKLVGGGGHSTGCVVNGEINKASVVSCWFW
jgi:hypothetical protein